MCAGERTRTSFDVTMFGSSMQRVVVAHRRRMREVMHDEIQQRHRVGVGGEGDVASQPGNVVTSRTDRQQTVYLLESGSRSRSALGSGLGLGSELG